MHLQISGSPGDTASNISAIVVALTNAKVNIVGIGPAFDPPHVRVAVEHGEDYNGSKDDPIYQALYAMQQAGLAPVIKPAVAVWLPNKKVGALQAVLDRLMREGYAAESILLLAGGDGERTQVQVGVAPAMLDGWRDVSDKLAALIEGDVANLP